MNTEHLFGVYLAKQRLLDGNQRRQPESPSDFRSAREREAAALRVFEAIRASVEDSQRHRRIPGRIY